MAAPARDENPAAGDSSVARREREQLAIPDPAALGDAAAAALPPFPLDDTKTFDYPGIEPTLNQTVILRGMKDNDIASCLSSTANPHVERGDGVAYAPLPRGSNFADDAPDPRRGPPSAAYRAALRSAEINYKSAETPYDPRGYVAGYAADPLRAIPNGGAGAARGFPGGRPAGFPFGSLAPLPGAYAENRENVPLYPGAGRAADVPPFSHYEPKARAGGGGGGSRSCDSEMWQGRSLQAAGRHVLTYPQGDDETGDLRRKLGAAELEIRTLRDSLLKVQNDHSAQLKKMEDKIRNRDKHMESLKKRCQKSSEERDERERKLQSVERYLSALPTAEDRQRDLLQMKELESLKSSLQYRVEALESRLHDKDREILDRKTTEEELTATVQSLQQKLEALLPSRSPPRDLDATQLKQENHNAKKIINILKKKLESLTEENAEKVRLLEERVAQEEEENQALRDALAERDGGLHALQGAVKELAAQNQELLDGHLGLKEELQEAAGASRGRERLARDGAELRAQMGLCFAELRALCRVVCQRLRGHDPNLSLLLGIQSVTHGERDDEGGSASGPEASLAGTLEAVRQLRREVDEARAVVSERYAEDVGENCAVQ